MSKKINYIISELKDQYLIEDNLRPWIIGFSGGKDSTALLQLVWLAISEVPIEDRKREVHVVCNDDQSRNDYSSFGRYILGQCDRKRVSSP